MRRLFQRKLSLTDVDESDERERWIKSTERTNVFIRMFKRGEKTNSIKRATLELNSS